MHGKVRFQNVMFGASLRLESAVVAIVLVLLLPISVFLFMTLTAERTEAQTFAIIHEFTGGADGATPVAGLTMDRAANLYGTTIGGGSGGGYGVVYRVSRQASGWTLNTLYSFTGGTDGDTPQAGVLIGPDGSIYGTTEFAGGGGDCRYYDHPPGCGTVFKLKPSAHVPANVMPSWTERTIHTFAGNGDGAYPISGLVFDGSGNLYGSTFANNRSELNGVVYELTPSNSGWVENTLHSFTGGTDGRIPSAVIFDSHGNLYGTTGSGGVYGEGTIFKLTHAGDGWMKEILYNFQNGADGGGPSGGLIFDQEGNLYGTAENGSPNATVFMLTPSGGSWVFNVIHTFDRFQESSASLVMDASGNLYGTTVTGGVGCGYAGCGTVFKMTRGANGWTYRSLHDFIGIDGQSPESNLILDGSRNLYGTTSSGGAFGHGVIFEITP